MFWKRAVVGGILTLSAFILLGTGIFAITLIGKDGGKGGTDRNSPGDDRKIPGEERKVPESRKTPEGGTKDEKDENIKNPKRKPGALHAKCAELKPVPGLKLQQLQGAWILQEKLEFPDGMTHRTVIPHRDQTTICLRTELVDVTDKGCTLLTDFYMKNQMTKNFTGFIKVKENMHWNFHMLAKDHDGMVVEADLSRYFIFIECVISKSSKNAEDLNTPGSVFIYTKGNLPEFQMDKLRANIEAMLRHDDETFLDFGGYCFDKKGSGGSTSAGNPQNSPTNPPPHSPQNPHHSPQNPHHSPQNPPQSTENSNKSPQIPSHSSKNPSHSPPQNTPQNEDPQNPPHSSPENTPPNPPPHSPENPSNRPENSNKSPENPSHSPPQNTTQNENPQNPPENPPPNPPSHSTQNTSHTPQNQPHSPENPPKSPPKDNSHDSPGHDSSTHSDPQKHGHQKKDNL